MCGKGTSFLGTVSVMADDALVVLTLDTDYSDSPLWSDEGLLDREDIPLTDATWSALEEWARYYNDHHDDSHRWTRGSQRLPYLERGHQLAERVAAEIGHDFAVKHVDRIFRSETAATNPAAANALREMVRSG